MTPSPQPPTPNPSAKILHLCAVDFTVRQFIAPLALRQQAEGYDVRCACTTGPHWEELREMGVRMIAMPIARSANPFAALGSVLRLRSWLKRERIDVLHVHTPVASMVGRLAGWLAGVPMIVYTAHGFYFHDRMPKKNYRRHVMLERFFARFQDAMFCVSREDVETARKLGIGKPARTFYVGNGVDTKRFVPAAALPTAREDIRDELDIPRNAIVVAMMGRLVREKGYRELFAAARSLAPKHPRLHFLIVGDTVVSEHDSAKEEIVAMSRAPELQGRTHFTGMRRDIPELLAASDIFVLPSYREGMPVSVLEAMAAGLPVVATRIRGCREAIDDGETGFLVEPQDADELTDAIDFLLMHLDDAARLGAKGRERAVEYFDEARVLDREIELYRQLLSGKCG